MTISNSKKYPEAWVFYVEQARNITEESTLNHLGNYRIPKPNQSNDFIYADKVEQLWSKFIRAWFDEDLNSPSIRGKIQYIVNNF